MTVTPWRHTPNAAGAHSAKQGVMSPRIWHWRKWRLELVLSGAPWKPPAFVSCEEAWLEEARTSSLEKWRCGRRVCEIVCEISRIWKAVRWKQDEANWGVQNEAQWVTTPRRETPASIKNLQPEARLRRGWSTATSGTLTYNPERGCYF